MNPKRIRTFFKIFPVVLLVAALLLCGLLCIMMYKHTKRPNYPDRRKEEHVLFREVLLNTFKAESISFFTTDAIKISGLLLTRPQAKKNILVCHGYRMAKERMHRFALMFPDDNLLLFDYRAHGQSSGDHSTIGYAEKKDVLGALQFLKEHNKTQDLPIIGIGVSMGAVTLLCAAAESDLCRAIILDAPFARLDEQVHRMLTHRYKLPSFPFGMVGKKFFERLRNFSLNEVDSVSSARQLKIPVLMIHSINDETVPIENAYRIYENISAPKDLWVVSGSGHARIFTDKPHEYQMRVNAFADSVIPL